MTLPTKPQTRAGMPPRRARVLLGATYKVGKTTLLGTWAPTTTLIIDTQNGSLLLEGDHYVEHVSDWPTFVRVVDDICRGGHMFHTIGLDLVNDLWRFCDLYHGKTENGLRTPASGVDDYQRSIKRAVTAFNAQVGRLFAAPVGLWFLTHLRERLNIKGELTSYVPDMDKNVHAYIAGAVDFLWLAETQKNGRRVVHTQPTQHFEAGSRVPIPSPLPMDVGEIARAMDRALNPQDYDEQGNRKTAEPAPGPVAPAADVEVATAPPEQRDVKRCESSDVPAEDPWFTEIAPLLKGVPSTGLKAAVTAAGGEVPERVSSWQRVICALDAGGRERFVKALSELADDPWSKPDAEEEHDGSVEMALDLDAARAEV